MPSNTVLEQRNRRAYAGYVLFHAVQHRFPGMLPDSWRTIHESEREKWRDAGIKAMKMEGRYHRSQLEG